MPIDVHLKAELDAMDEEYGGENMYKILGPTSLSYASTDSSREYMFTSHLKQVLTLLNPDVPRLQTGFEKPTGEYSHAYCKLEGTWEVKDIIEKYPGRSGIYTIVVYNKKANTWDMIEKKVAENLTEKFGFIYNTDRMDSLKVGDRLVDEVIYKSTSYDKHMNYRYGKNANVYFSTSTDTLEDAIRIRRSWANQVRSVEVDVVRVPINDNDVPLNLYGDPEHYKAFPDIGEHVKNSVLCATRRVNKNHLLYDFQAQNMQTIYSTDEEYYVSKGSEVYDIDIFYNGNGDFPENLFFGQLAGYFKQQSAYADKMYSWATKIKKSGAKYTENVTYFRSRYMHWNDPDWKWKNKDRAFGNMIIEFKVRSAVDLDPGSKLSGRYGDKGVIGEFTEDVNSTMIDSVVELVSDNPTPEEKKAIMRSIEIVDDERMPYTDDVVADIELNMSGSIRRLNPAQTSEVEVNFQARKIQQYIKTLPIHEEKLETIFKFLNLINAKQGSFYQALYESYDSIAKISVSKMYPGVDDVEVRLWSRDAQEFFVKDVEEHGFYLIRPPHKPLVYDDIKRVYEEFPWIKPDPLYINLYGKKKRRIMKDGIIGSKYMIVLKQNSNKNFSARSTYRVSRTNLPTKDIAKKTNRSAYARTAVRLSEIYNLLASVSGRDIAEWNIFTRSSALGRKSLQRILAADGNPLEVKKLKVHDNYINTNADILAAKLKGIGLRIRFYTGDELTPDMYIDAATEMKINGYTIVDSPKKFNMYQDLFNRFDKRMQTCSMMETHAGQKQEYCWNEVFEDEEIKRYNLSDSTKQMLIAATQCTLSLLDQVKSKSKVKDANLDQADKTNPDGTPVIRRRGRRPKVKQEEVKPDEAEVSSDKS